MALVIADATALHLESCTLKSVPRTAAELCLLVVRLASSFDNQPA